MLEELEKYVVATPMPFAVDLAASEGMWLATVDGQRLFDWAGYYGSKMVGHNHPALYEPEYLRRLATAANNKVANPDFLTQECLDYYRLLYRIAPEIMRGDGLEVYAVNSGAEAVENMMKYLVAKFNLKRQGTSISNRRFLYFDRAFHGRTVFALNVTQTMDPVATKDFHGLTQGGNIMLPFPAFDSSWSRQQNLANAVKALEQVESALSLMAKEVVGIIVEPIQGAGGQRVALNEFFQGLSHLAHEYGVYMAYDEVQTGGGATGKMWGIDHFNLPHPPMAIASGKKLGNGVVYMLERLEDVGVLDSTWGGTLVDMVRVVREFQIVDEDGLIEKAEVNGKFLAETLEGLVKKYSPMTFNVRGLGLYQGFSLDTPERKGQLIDIALNEFNLLLLGAGKRSIRTRPNMNVSREDIVEFGVLLDKALARLI
ncbi:L-lysine 6-transaminase [soil metagenome]